MNNKWLIWSFEHRGWWCKNQMGYTIELKEAGSYTFEQAEQIVRGANDFKGMFPPNEAMLPDYRPNSENHGH